MTRSALRPAAARRAQAAPHTDLIGGAGGAGVLSQALHLVQRAGVRGVADRRRGRRPELVTAGEQERCDRAPVGEDRRREVGRGGAIVTRLGACGKGGGVAAEPSAARSPMSNWATVAPTRIPSRCAGCWDRAEFSGEQLVEAALRRRVEGGQDVMGGLIGGGVRPRVTGRRHREQVGLAYVGDGDHRVVLGRLQNGETAGRWIVAGCRPGVPSRVISSRFQSMTDCPDPGWNAACAGTVLAAGPGWPRARDRPCRRPTQRRPVKAHVILRIRVLSVTPDGSANRWLDRTPRLPLIRVVDGQRSPKTTTLCSACGSRLLPGASTTTDSGGAEVNAPGMRIGPPARVALARRIPESRPGALGRDHC